MKLGVISLGCDKATVDSDGSWVELSAWRVVQPDLRLPSDSVNTCGFIDAASRSRLTPSSGAS